jgi:hypothetical protein
LLLLSSFLLNMSLYAFLYELIKYYLYPINAMEKEMKKP